MTVYGLFIYFLLLEAQGKTQANFDENEIEFYLIKGDTEVVNGQTKKSGEIPVTKKLLYETRSELKSDIASVRLEMKEGFNQVDARFKQIDARFIQVDARFDGLESKMEKLMAVVHRTNALVEEQVNQNKFVLDGYTSLNDKFDNQQKLNNERFDQIETSISRIKKGH